VIHVPAAVRAIAAAIPEKRKISEALASGQVSIGVLKRIVRFNRLNCERVHVSESASAAWDHYGREAGYAFATATLLGKTPVSLSLGTLLHASVTEIAEALGDDGWRTEWNLTEASVGRFLWERLRQEHDIPDMVATFGSHADAVGEAIEACYKMPEVFGVIAEHIQGKYADAARCDLNELAVVRPLRMLDESLKWQQLIHQPAVVATKMIWPTFIGYLVLATEDKAKIKELNKSTKKPPGLEDAVSGFAKYSDAINAAITYMHPHGAKWEDPSKVHGFENLMEKFWDLIEKAYHGWAINKITAHQTLELFHKWIVHRKLNGGIFHIYLAAWIAKDWTVINGGIPAESDVGVPFGVFTEEHVTKFIPAPAAAPTPAPAPIAAPTSVPAPEPTPEPEPVAAPKPTLQSGWLAAHLEDKYAAGYTDHPENWHPLDYLETKTASAFIAATAGTQKQYESITQLLHVKSGVIFTVKAVIEVKDLPATDENGEAVVVDDVLVICQDDDGDIDDYEDDALAAKIESGEITPVWKKAPEMPKAYVPKFSVNDIVRNNEEKMRYWIGHIGTKAGVTTYWLAPLALFGATSVKVIAETFDESGENEFIGTASTAAKACAFISDPTGDGKAELAYATKTYTIDLDGYSWAYAYTAKDGKWVMWRCTAETIDADIEDTVTFPLIAVFPPVVSKPVPAFKAGDILIPKGKQVETHMYVLAVDETAGKYKLALLLPMHGSPVTPDIDFKAVDDAYGVVVHNCHPADAFKWLTKPPYLTYGPKAMQMLGGVTVGNVTYYYIDSVTQSGGPPQWIVGQVIGGVPVASIIDEPVEAPTSSLALGYEVSQHHQEYAEQAGYVFVPVPPGEFPIGTEVVGYGTTEVVSGYVKKTSGSASILAKTFMLSQSPGGGPPSIAFNPEAWTKKEPDQFIPPASGYVVSQQLQDWANDLHYTLVHAPAGEFFPVGTELTDKIGAGVVVTVVGWVRSHPLVSGQKPMAVVKNGDGKAYFTVSKPSNWEKKEEGQPSSPLGYAPSEEVTAWIANHQGYHLVPAPEGVFFPIGTQVKHTSGAEGVVAGWFWFKDSTAPGQGTPLVQDVAGEVDPVSFKFQWSQQEPALPDGFGHVGVATFKPGENNCAVTIDTVSIPCEKPQGWNNPTAVEQPTFATIAGKKPAAGCVVVFPPGAAIGGATTGCHYLLLVHPLNEFGGYSKTFPKGGVDPGESTEKAAVREVFEEVGISCVPLAHLGDYMGSTSITRLFIAKPTGGSLTGFKDQDPQETEETFLVPMDNYEDSNWYAELSVRDKQVVKDTEKWLTTNGNILAAKPKQADYTSQPTAATDNAGQNIPPAPYEDVWEALLEGSVPFTTDMIQAVKKKLQGQAIIKLSTTAGAEYGMVNDDTGSSFWGCFVLGSVGVETADGALKTYVVMMTQAATFICAPLSELPSSGWGPPKTPLDEPAYYVHPDANKNHLIQTTAAQGNWHGTLTEFRKLLKEAEFPHYAQVSKELIKPAATLFLPGMPWKLKAIMLNCLKARAALKQKKGSAKAPPANATQMLPPPSITSDPLITKTLALSGDKLTLAGAGPGGGSKPIFFATTADGAKWILKAPAHGDSNAIRPFTDAAAFKLANMVKDNNVPATVVKLGGKTYSAQPFIADAKELGFAVDTSKDLSESDMIAIMQQHVFDMFVGNHDGHGNNWLRTTTGKLVPIDIGQAFKFVTKGIEESLDPAWNAPGNVGQPVAKQLLIDWSKSKTVIAPAVFAAMRKTMLRVAAITDDDLESTIAPIAQEGGYSDSKLAGLLARMKTRRDGYVEAWTAEMAKLAKQRGEKWEWAAYTKSYTLPSSVPAHLHDYPDKQGFSDEEHKSVSIAAQAQWAGRSMQIDRDAIDNQEVMVKRVILSGTTETAGTVIYFRVARHAAVAAIAKLGAVCGVVESTGPAVLPFDSAVRGSPFYGVIYDAQRSVDSHCFEHNDGNIKVAKVEAVIAVRKQLQALLLDVHGEGNYQTIPKAVVRAMIAKYLPFCLAIEEAGKNPQAQIGKKLPPIEPFVWAPEASASDTSEPSDITIKKRVDSGFMPDSAPTGKNVKMDITPMALVKPNGHGQTQFVITSTQVPGATVYFNSPHGEVKSFRGQVWGIIPGEPTVAHVAALLNLFERAAGIGMKPPTDKDKEVLYLAKQVYLAQDTGTGFKPGEEGSDVTDGAYKQAMADYQGGNAEAARTKLSAILAAKLNTTPAKLKDLPGWNPEFHHPNDVGFGESYRVGVTREDIVAKFGKVFLAHRVDNVLTMMQKLTANNGAIFAAYIKRLYGLPMGVGSNAAGNSSAEKDLRVGGGQGFFACMRKIVNQPDLILYFDPSAFLRTDVVVVGGANDTESIDAYGSVTAKRYLTPESWKNAKSNSGSLVGDLGDSVSPGSQWQFHVRNALDVRKYLHTVVLSDGDKVKKALAICAAAGWTSFARGRTPEKVFVVRENATWE